LGKDFALIAYFGDRLGPAKSIRPTQDLISFGLTGLNLAAKGQVSNSSTFPSKSIRFDFHDTLLIE